MKNKFFIKFYFALFFSSQSLAENLNIEAKNITLDKGRNLSIFKDEVTIITAEQNKIEADYVEYDRNEEFLILKNNISAQDNQNNIIKTNYAEYDEKNKIFKSKGNTEIITTDKYVIKTADVILDSINKIILSKSTTEIEDVDGNKVFLEGFEYYPQNNIFRSVGKIEIRDNKQNNYNFSQIYIDTKKKEILGTDIKAFLNQKEFKLNEKNKPRVFANTINLDRSKKQFDKSVFTLCDYRENDKCPPWTIQATKMLHDNKKKTIYYNNAVIKVYNVPIFYFPKLSHPDPSVERRSGFLLPMLSDTKNLGLGFTIPYFFAINEDKNFTLTSRIFQSENPLFLGEYHQAFKDSYLFTDFGYTEGYRGLALQKKLEKNPTFFGRFVKNFIGKNNSQNTLSLDYQDVSNDKYLKLYRIESNLVDYNTSTLESSLRFTHENDDLFLGVNTSIFETLKKSYNDKYEYFLPEITLDKNLVSNRYGNLNLQSNLKVHNYDTNKTSNFLTNDFNWVSKNLLSENGVTGQILGNIKNINYSTKNIDLYKDDSTNELFGALGYLAEIDLEKNSNEEKASTYTKNVSKVFTWKYEKRK